MSRVITFLGAALVLSTTFYACKKDDNGSSGTSNSPGGIAEMQKQLEGTWKIESKTRYVADANGNLTPTDVLDNCEKDDTYTFTGNFYVANAGTVPCSYPMAYGTQFQWALYKDSTFDFIYGPGFNTNPRMDFINATTMQLSARFAGTADKAVYVYKRK